MSTDVIHVISDPRLSPFFATLPLPVYYTKGLGTRLIIDVSETRSILKKEEVYGHTVKSGY